MSILLIAAFVSNEASAKWIGAQEPNERASVVKGTQRHKSPAVQECELSPCVILFYYNYSHSLHHLNNKKRRH